MGALDRSQAAQTPPLRITGIVSSNGNVVVRWEGGKGPYQLLCRTNLTTDWRGAGSSTSGFTASSPIEPGSMCFFMVTTDLTAPGTPTNLRVSTNASYDSLTLSWTASADNTGGAGLKGYNLYRNSSFITQVLSPATSLTDRGLQADTSYSYAIAAIDRVGNESSKTAAVAGRTPRRPDTLAPSTPLGLTATASACSNINLSWGASTDTGGSGLKGYDIYRDGVFVKQVLAPATSTADAGVSASTSYSYRVLAVDNAGNPSAQSVAATATTPACPDLVPPSVTLTSPAHGSTVSGTITLSANATDNLGVSRVEFYRGAAVLLGTVTAAPFNLPFNTTTVSNGAQGFYCRAYDAANNQRFSGTNTVTVSNAAAAAVGRLEWVRTMLAPQGGGSAYALSTAVDAGGNVVVVGWFMGTVDLGAGVISSLGGSAVPDGFVVRYSPQGAVLWAKRLGGDHYDYARSVAVDSQSNILIAGNFNRTVDFGGGPLTSAGGEEIFVVKYSPAGTHLWSRRFGGTGNEAANAVTVDGGDDVVIAARFGSISADFGATTVSRIGAGDLVLTKLAGGTGAPIWAKGWGLTDSIIPQAIAVDSSGDVVVSGYFWTATDLGGGRLNSAGGADLFLAKYGGGDGRYRWGKRVGGAGGDSALAVVTDPRTGTVLITGPFSGVVDFGGGLVDSGANGGLYLAGYDSAGNYLWATATGGPGDYGAGLAVDPNGNLALTGRTSYGVVFGGGNPPLYSNGQPDFFVVSLRLNGASPPSFRWGKISGIGTTGNSIGNAIATDPSGRVYTSGSFSLTADFGGISATAPSGYTAGFASKYSQ